MSKGNLSDSSIQKRNALCQYGNIQKHVGFNSNMADEPEKKYSQEQLESDDVSKKDILSFLQEHASKAVGVISYSAQIFAQSCLPFLLFVGY